MHIVQLLLQNILCTIKILIAATFLQCESTYIIYLSICEYDFMYIAICMYIYVHAHVHMCECTYDLSVKYSSSLMCMCIMV